MARLTYQQRKRLPPQSFVFPRRVAGKEGAARAGRGAYPIPDVAHARNALARVSRFGTPSEKATVRAKVKAKFPGVAVGGKKPTRRR